MHGIIHIKGPKSPLWLVYKQQEEQFVKSDNSFYNLPHGTTLLE